MQAAGARLGIVRARAEKIRLIWQARTIGYADKCIDAPVQGKPPARVLLEQGHLGARWGRRREPERQ